MPRILGIDLPKEKRIEAALPYIYGIGPALTRQILAQAQISLDKRAKDLTEEEIKSIEKEVDSNIQKGCNVIREEMPLEEAKKIGISGVFEHKYGNIVSVYTIGECSKEICTGPHVKNTAEIGSFTIIKCEKIGNNLLRIYAK